MDDQYYYDDYEYVGFTQQTSNPAPVYNVIDVNTVYKKLIEEVENVNDLLAKGSDWCLLIFEKFRWNYEKLSSDFFKPQNDNLLASLHYTPKPYSIGTNPGYCVVCEGNSPLATNVCGHAFCTQCWKDYVVSNIEEKNVFLKCMMHGCGAPALHSFIQKLLEHSESITNKYHKYLAERFVETNIDIKFCPGADCGFCIESNSSTLKEVECSCGKVFCFKCKEEVHRPCDCQEVRNWKDIVEKEEANAKWLSINTKICPFCNKHVERSMGCNYMHCLPPGGCGKAFCYVCSKPWEPDHKDHFKCNVFKQSNKEKEELDNAKSILAKINFYCEKFLSNQHSKKKLIEEQKKVGDMQVDMYTLIGLEYVQTEFIANVYKFLITACDVLKWSYAHCFFLEDNNKSNKELLEFNQGEFERYKENIVIKLETKLKPFLEQIRKEKNLDKEGRREELLKLKEEIVSYYKSSESYMNELIKTIQKAGFY